MRRPSLRGALLFVLGIFLLYLVVGIPLQLLLGEAGLALTQLGIFLGGTLLFVRLGGFDPVATLSLRPFSARAGLGGLLLWMGGVPLGWFLVWLQSFVVEVPVELLEAMRGLLETDDPLRMLWLLVLVAAIPAVAEEFVFRGVVLSGLSQRVSPMVAVLLTGALFGLVHAPQAAFRFLPTAWLGILLAWVVWSSRSIWLGVLLHFLNNGTILLLSFLPATRELASDPEKAPPLLLLPISLILLGVGARILGEAAKRGSEAEL